MSISDRVKQLNFPFGQYVVVGGAMEAFGIRKAKDIDIVVTPALFKELRKNGWKDCDCIWCQREIERGGTRRMLKGDNVDILSEYSCGDAYHANTDELIKNAAVIEG